MNALVGTGLARIGNITLNEKTGPLTSAVNETRAGVDYER